MHICIQYTYHVYMHIYSYSLNKDTSFGVTMFSIKATDYLIKTPMLAWGTSIQAVAQRSPPPKKKNYLRYSHCLWLSPRH